MSSESAPKCPVFFCGTPNASVGFDTFFANAGKQGAVTTIRIDKLTEVASATQSLEHGIVVLLLANKNELVAVLNALPGLKKRVDKGVVRTLVYAMIENPKLQGILKAKGCTELLQEGLTQKALIHKLQRHVQLVQGKQKTASAAAKAADTRIGSNKKDQGKDAASKGTLKFIAALQDPNDCWLVKTKKDFKYVRGNWIGEMIGPGPGVGSWAEAGGTTKQTVYRWSPRNTQDPDPFIPTKGSWFTVGRKPEFDWKINRWRFIGETPSLFFKAAGSDSSVYRFRATAAAKLEVTLNSAVAKGKLKAIMATFAQEKVIKDDKAPQAAGDDLTLEHEKKKKAGNVTFENEKKEDKAYGGELTPDEDPEAWGDMREGEEETTDWNDKSKEGEEEDAADWNGTDIGRGNKFNGGRGVGQGDGDGNKGYKHDEEEGAAKKAESAETEEKKKKAAADEAKPEFNDKSGEGEDEKPHDWNGTDVGRGNKFESGRGLGQGTGEKGYKYEDEEEEGKKKSGDEEEGDGLDFEDLDFKSDKKKKAKKPGSDSEDFDMDNFGEDAASGDADPDEAAATEDDDSGLTVDSSLDEVLDAPTEWKSGAEAFEKITLSVAIDRPDSPGSKTLEDVVILERQEEDLLMDVPQAGFKPGERVAFAVEIGQSGKKKKLQLSGLLKTTDPQAEAGREIILINVAVPSRPHLVEIQKIFDAKQAELLKFLREAKG